MRVVGAALIRDGRCLATRRGPGVSLAGKWEFPGGKIEPGETPEAALARELKEELDIDAEIGPWLGRGFNTTDDGRPVVLDVYEAYWDGRPVTLHDHDLSRWCEPFELDGLEWAPADVPILPAVRRRLEAYGCGE